MSVLVPRALTEFDVTNPQHRRAAMSPVLEGRLDPEFRFNLLPEFSSVPDMAKSLIAEAFLRDMAMGQKGLNNALAAQQSSTKAVDCFKVDLNADRFDPVGSSRLRGWTARKQGHTLTVPQLGSTSAAGAA